MKRELVLRREAEAGIAEAVNFYALQADAAKQNFIAALEEAFDAIASGPRLYTVRHQNIRRFNFSRFPYALWFEVIPGKDELTSEEMEFVVVLRCYHQRKNVTPRSFE